MKPRILVYPTLKRVSFCGNERFLKYVESKLHGIKIMNRSLYAMTYDLNNINVRTFMDICLLRLELGVDF